MRVRWTKKALRDFERMIAYIETEEARPEAARGVAQKVWDATVRLEDFPRLGRPGRVKGTREWVVSSTPLVIIYRVSESRVVILRILHSAQRK